MTRIAILDSNNVIINIVDSTVSHVTASGFSCKATNTGQIGQQYVNNTWVTPEVVQIKSWQSVLYFKKEFTLQEHATILNASRTDGMVGALLDRLNSSPQVLANDPDLIAGLNYLVYLNIITDEKKNSILG